MCGVASESQFRCHNRCNGTSQIWVGRGSHSSLHLRKNELRRGANRLPYFTPAGCLLRAPSSPSWLKLFLRYTDLGVQDAARPRTGPSPPERSLKKQVLTNLLFARRSGPRARLQRRSVMSARKSTDRQFPIRPNLEQLRTRLKIFSAPLNREIPLRSKSCANIIPYRPASTQLRPSWLTPRQL